jgi:PAS domain-containing protein
MVRDDFAYDFDAPDSDWNYEPSRADLFRQVSAPLYTTDAQGWLTYYNDAAAELWGFRPILGKARWCGAWRLYDMDGLELPHDHCALAIALREGAALRGAQAVLERPDGNRVAFMPYPTLLRDRTGMLVGGSNILLKIERAPRRSVATRGGGAGLRVASNVRPARFAGMHG